MDSLSNKVDEARDALKRAAHKAGADELAHRMNQATGGMGERVAESARRAADETISPEIRQYPVEFSMAVGAGAMGIALMLWWGWCYVKPQSDVSTELARRGGPNVEDTKKMAEAQQPRLKKVQP